MYARWSNTEYTVNFDANGGSCSTTSKTVAYAKNYGTLPTPNKTGHSFEGWYTEISGGTKINDNSTYNETSNSTLYAHWSSSKYTVYFNGNGGSCSTGSMSVTYGSAYGTLPTASRDYYNFAGWYTSASGGEYISTATIYKDTNDLTLYAHWNEISVKEINGIPGNKTIGVGEGFGVSASVYPSNATNRNISWSSSNNGVATVNNSGYVYGKAKGTATITAECGGIRRSFTVTVMNVTYGYDLSKGSINFGGYMYAPNNQWVKGNSGNNHIHIEFGTKNEVKNYNQVIFYSRTTTGMFGVFIEGQRLVIATRNNSSNNSYNIHRTGTVLQPNTKYRIEIDPSGSYNIKKNDVQVESSGFTSYRFSVGGIGVKDIPGAYTSVGAVESWYDATYRNSPAADIYLYQLNTSGFTHYDNNCGPSNQHGHNSATGLAVNQNGLVNNAQTNNGAWIFCKTPFTNINKSAITKLYVNY